MNLYPGLKVVLRLDGELTTLTVQAEGDGARRIGPRSPVARLLNAMDVGDSAVLIAPVEDPLPLHVEFLAIQEQEAGCVVDGGSPSSAGADGDCCGTGL